MVVSSIAHYIPMQLQKKFVSPVAKVIIGMAPLVENNAPQVKVLIWGIINVNALLDCSGTVIDVFLVWVGKSSTINHYRVSVQMPQNGMDSAVLIYLIVRMEPNGTYLVLLVNVLMVHFGMGHSVRRRSNAQVDNIEMFTINVNVQKDYI